ncbi:hypothetical protein I532_08102 [Brevibacillus borstelensis AK1]|uniref:Uncharacterized protein n=1 Tax=Brevibacillus borstelensis AK1 TaxID=1300222 RepID=M8E0B0_9BACL|nr:hypothetical protein [Brevibacillus borstelensis]EMT52726.1 hypothetical protein I532_08102 [Brevibacillus borstelensis AK1]
MKRFFTFLEWFLVICLGGQVLLLLIASFTVLFANADEIRSAKKEGTFYPGPGISQTYYNRELTVDGVRYDGSTLKVYMTSRGSGSASLPSFVNIASDTGQDLDVRSGGQSFSWFVSKGYYLIKEAPSDLQSIRIYAESYGQSFSFTVPLAKGGME